MASGSSRTEADTDELVQRDIESSRVEHFRFLRDEGELSKEPTSLAEAEARAEYDRVFKEFAIANLSQYRMGRMGLRWRSQSEVISGKGQSVCANQTCTREANLSSFEVDFAYREHGVDMNALVKVRLCPKCAKRMFKARRQSSNGSGGGDDDDNSSSGSDFSSRNSRSRQRRHHEHTSRHRERRGRSEESRESDNRRRRSSSSRSRRRRRRRERRRRDRSRSK